MRELQFSAASLPDEDADYKSLERFERIADAADLLALGGEIRRVARHLGFNHYLYGARVQLANGDTLQYIYSGYPEDWMARYHDAGYIMIDPVVEHCFCRNACIPLVWSERAFDTPERRAFLEDAQGHGLGSGLSVPVRGAHGELALFSVANPEQGKDALAHQAQIAGTMYVLGSYVHEAIRRLVYFRQGTPVYTPELTPREMECLKWWVSGKSAWDIGQLLKLSERTVRFHLDNVKRKFGAHNKSQVVAKAVQLKLVPF